jgi:hypothetical protein
MAIGSRTVRFVGRSIGVWGGDHPRICRSGFLPRVGLLVALAVAGCSTSSPTASAAPTQSASARPSPTASPTATPSPTPTPVPTPAPTGFQSQPDGTLTWYTLSGEQRTVPTVDGLTVVLKAGVVEYHDSKGAKQGVFVQNFTLFATDGTGIQTGCVVLTGTVISGLLASKPDVMPLPYAINEATGMVMFGYDRKGFDGFNEPADSPRAWIEIPNGDYVRVSEFNPQNYGSRIQLIGPGAFDLKGRRITDAPYMIFDLAWETTRSPLGHVSIMGNAAGSTNDPGVNRDIRNRLPLGTSLLGTYGVSGESEIQM